MKKNKRLHILVAIHFVPNPHNLKIVNHIDLDSFNNHYSNLEWVNTMENVCHALKNKKMSSPYIGVMKVKKTGRYSSRITNNGIRIVLGTFDEEIDAYNARIAYQEKHNILNRYK